jgi:hypothetical protein
MIKNKQCVNLVIIFKINFVKDKKSMNFLKIIMTVKLTKYLRIMTQITIISFK